MGLGDSGCGSDCGIGSIYHGVCRPQDFQYSSPRHDASILWSGPSSREFFQFIPRSRSRQTRAANDPSVFPY